MTATIEQAGQRWNAETYARNGRFVADLGAPLLKWLAPRSGEHILDVGCGDGALTEKIASTGAAVVGVDASEELVAAAKARRIDARLVDGQALAFHAEFDAAFSNAALHWMKRDPDAVLVGVARALKPGGRFVAEMGGAGNVAKIHEALRVAVESRGVNADQCDPWYFPDQDEYAQRLLQAGFEIERIETFARPTPLPSDVAAWLRTFGQSFLATLPADQREPVLTEIQESLRSSLCDVDGRWVADYVRLRFSVTKWC